MIAFNLQLARIQAAGYPREVAYTLSRDPFYSAAQARGFSEEVRYAAGQVTPAPSFRGKSHEVRAQRLRTAEQIRSKAESNRRQRERKKLLKLQQMALALTGES